MKNLWQKILGFLLLVLPSVLVSIFPELGELGGVIYLSATMAGIFTLTMVLTEALKNPLNLSGWSTRIFSWLIATLLIIFSNQAGWGFVDHSWFELIISGIGVGVAANGWFTIEQVKMFLAALFPILRKNT